MRAVSRGRTGYSRVAQSAPSEEPTATSDNPKLQRLEVERQLRKEAAARRELLAKQVQSAAELEAAAREEELKKRRGKMLAAQSIIAASRQQRELQLKEKAKTALTEARAMDTSDAQEKGSGAVGGFTTRVIGRSVTPPMLGLEPHYEHKQEAVQGSGKPRVVKVRSTMRAGGDSSIDYSDAFQIHDDNTQTHQPVTTIHVSNDMRVLKNARAVEKPVPEHIWKLLRGAASEPEETAAPPFSSPAASSTGLSSPALSTPSCDDQEAPFGYGSSAAVSSGKARHTMHAADMRDASSITNVVGNKPSTLEYNTVESSTDTAGYSPKNRATVAAVHPSLEVISPSAAARVPLGAAITSHIPKPGFRRLPSQPNPNFSKTVVAGGTTVNAKISSPQRKGVHAQAEPSTLLLSPARSFSPLHAPSASPHNAEPTGFQPPKPPKPRLSPVALTRLFPSGASKKSDKERAGADGMSVTSWRTGASRASSQSRERAPVPHASRWGMGLHEAVNAERRLADIRRKEYELKVREEAALRRLRSRSRPRPAVGTVIKDTGVEPSGSSDSGQAVQLQELEEQLDESLARLNDRLQQRKVPPQQAVTSITSKLMMRDVPPKPVTCQPSIAQPATLHQVHDPQPSEEPAAKPRFQLWMPDSRDSVTPVTRVPVGAALPVALASVIARTKALAAAAAHQSSRAPSPDSLDSHHEMESDSSSSVGSELDSTMRMVESLRRSREKHKSRV